MANSSIQYQVEEGLKVVTARFRKVEPFSWNLFDGFHRMRVLTYSASAMTIARMLKEYTFAYFECIFGFEEGLVADVVTAYQILNNPAGDYSIQLENDTQRVIFEGMQAGTARFYVVKENVAHAKLYLLETNGGERRKVAVGSANLSEPAFGGEQAETLVVFDNDAQAWEHYSHEYEVVKETASDELSMSMALREASTGNQTYMEGIRQGMTTDGMEGLWTPISLFFDVRNEPPPSAIRFPSGEERTIDYWRDVLWNVTDWLVSRGRLTTEDLPINDIGTSFQFINSVPVSPRGRPFSDPRRVSVGVYLEMKLNAYQIIGYCKRLLTHFSISLGDVTLRVK